MVFTKLSVQEKDAFFGLLDEYFQSRPQLFGQNGSGQGVSGLAGTGVSTATAASAIQRALATTGNASGGGAGSALAKSNNNNPYAASMPMPNSADVAHAVTVGRVAAASLAFSGGGLPSQLQSSSSSSSPSPSPSQSHTKPGDPPSLPRRGALSAPASAPLERIGLPGAEVDKLVTKKTSVFSAFRKPETAGVTIPPAFAPPKNGYGPPPVRRATSETSASASTGTGTSTPALARIGGGAPRLVAPKPNAEEEEGEEGEEEEVAEGGWAEVLYDYSSEDPGDLAIEAGTRVFVTDKSSDDWWTGQVEGQGRQGLFPASYVKLL